MSLNHIPKLDTPFPFLHEVDFKKLAEMVAGSETVKPKIIRPAGREDEVRAMRLALLSAGANNIWLQGAEGVGKTTIISGLLQKVAKREVTAFMLSKHIYIFDGHTFFKNETKDAFKEFDGSMEFLSKGNSLLIFDRIDDFVGMAGNDASYYLNGLAEYSRGQLQSIITSQTQNRSKIEKLSTAIAPAFVDQIVKEPSRADLVAMLRAHRPRLEAVHQVRIPEETVQEVIKIIERYPGRAFTAAWPQGPISFLDKSAAYVRMSAYGLPPVVTRKSDYISQLEDELEALKVSSRSTTKRREEIAQEIAAVRAEIDPLRKAWEEKYKPYADKMEIIAGLERQIFAIEQKRSDAAAEGGASSKYDLSIPDRKARDILLDALDKPREEAFALYSKINPEKPVVSTRDAQIVFSQESGISASTLSGDDKQKLLDADVTIGKDLFGQPRPVGVVAGALRDARTGVSDPGRPACVIMHVGGTGTGKTEVVKVLAVVDGGEGAKPVIIKMNQFKDSNSIPSFLGAQPGTVGFDKGAPHLEKIKKNPRCQALFDEIEKANDAFYDLIMQIFDEGVIDTSAGEEVTFKDTMVHVTSNVILPEDIEGYNELVARDPNNKKAIDALLGDQDLLRKALKAKINPKTNQPYFRPEFVERIDIIVMYDYLENEAAYNILRRKQIEPQNRNLSSRGIKLEVDDETARAIIDKFYVKSGGGRSVRQMYNQRIRPLISEAILKLPDATDDDEIRTIYIDFDGRDISLTHTKPSRPGTRELGAVKAELTEG